MLPQTSVVNPSYFVGFSSATIIASTILFNGLNTSGATNTISLLCGFFSTSIGVYLLVSIEFVCSDADLLTRLATYRIFRGPPPISRLAVPGGHRSTCRLLSRDQDRKSVV